MNKKILFSLLVIACSAFTTSYAQKVELTYTTPTERWVKAKKNTIEIVEDAEPDITIFTDEKLQVIDGLGGSFNELGWTAITSLPADKSKEVFNALFSTEGCNFSMCRLPLGASDYALSYYSCNDVAEDFVMRDFNIVRDQYILIPYIKEALKVRPDLKLWASPWSPPAWMKVNEHYSLRRGSFERAIDGNMMPEGAEILSNATGFKMQERYLEAYALYFSKFVQAYAEEGVPLFAIMPQNEIKWAPNWPSCTWRAEDMGYFIGKYLGPKFKDDKLDTEIWLGTVNNSNANWVKTILDNESASQYIDGVGFQWAGENAVPSIAKEYPSYKYMQTENKCGEHENDWTSLARSWSSMVHYFNNQTGSYMYWNMVLDETGKSAWGWPQNSMIVIDRDNQEIIYNDEFYLFKHISHFVQPGDHVLKASEGKDHVAFQLKDGSILVLINNPDEKAKTTTIKVGEQVISTQLQATSINSLIIK